MRVYAVLLSIGVSCVTVACVEEPLIAQAERERVDPSEPPIADPSEPDTGSGDECQTDSDCGNSTRCDSGVCVGVGAMSVTLRFDADSDFDLHVVLPDGVEVYFANDIAEGGVLDVDTCVAVCSAAPPYVENVVFSGAPPSGQFAAYATNYDGRSSGVYTIEVKGEDGASLQSTNGVLDGYASATSESLVWTIP